ncbi:hypothetical protein Hanom_Chr09g00759621 [Helianthus anomalus]
MYQNLFLNQTTGTLIFHFFTNPVSKPLFLIYSNHQSKNKFNKYPHNTFKFNWLMHGEKLD